jgi:hypothetical protein
VLTIGVSCCLFSSLVILPAVLVLITRRRAASGAGPAEQPPVASPGRPQRRIDSRHYRGSGGRGVPQPPQRRQKGAAA